MKYELEARVRALEDGIVKWNRSTARVDEVIEYESCLKIQEERNFNKEEGFLVYLIDKSWINKLYRFHSYQVKTEKEDEKVLEFFKEF